MLLVPFNICHMLLLLYTPIFQHTYILVSDKWKKVEKLNNLIHVEKERRFVFFPLFFYSFVKVYLYISHYWVKEQLHTDRNQEARPNLIGR